LPFFTEFYGNPSNGYHRLGRVAAQAVDDARVSVAEMIGAQAREIIFTAGATESNNLVIFGLTGSSKGSGRKRIVTSVVEHKSILQPCKKLTDQGFEVVFLPVDAGGKIRLDEAKKQINQDTLLVTIQIANNEIGTLQPVKELAELAHAAGAIIHCDAAQAVGKIPVSVEELNFDLCSLSGHKIYGPKGVGALFVGRHLDSHSLQPQVMGGGQESGMRSGTTNVPGIVGFGEASRIVLEVLGEESARLQQMRDRLETELLGASTGVSINGREHSRLPNTSSVTFKGVDADALIFNLPSIMIGTGSACSSGAVSPSHVLEAIGLTREAAYSTVRISLGRNTTEDDVVTAVEELIGAYQKIA